MDSRAGGTSRHLDAKGGPWLDNGLCWLLPLVGCADLARLSGPHVLLGHAREVHLVLLTAELVLGMWETGKVRALQDLVLIPGVVLPISSHSSQQSLGLF